MEASAVIKDFMRNIEMLHRLRTYGSQEDDISILKQYLLKDGGCDLLAALPALLKETSVSSTLPLTNILLSIASEFMRSETFDGAEYNSEFNLRLLDAVIITFVDIGKQKVSAFSSARHRRRTTSQRPRASTMLQRAPSESDPEESPMLSRAPVAKQNAYFEKLVSTLTKARENELTSIWSFVQLCLGLVLHICALEMLNTASSSHMTSVLSFFDPVFARLDSQFSPDLQMRILDWSTSFLSTFALCFSFISTNQNPQIVEQFSNIFTVVSTALKRHLDIGSANDPENNQILQLCCWRLLMVHGVSNSRRVLCQKFESRHFFQLSVDTHPVAFLRWLETSLCSVDLGSRNLLDNICTMISLMGNMIPENHDPNSCRANQLLQFLCATRAIFFREQKVEIFLDTFSRINLCMCIDFKWFLAENDRLLTTLSEPHYPAIFDIIRRALAFCKQEEMFKIYKKHLRSKDDRIRKSCEQHLLSLVKSREISEEVLLMLCKKSYRPAFKYLIKQLNNITASFDSGSAPGAVRTVARKFPEDLFDHLLQVLAALVSAHLTPFRNFILREAKPSNFIMLFFYNKPLIHDASATLLGVLRALHYSEPSSLDFHVGCLEQVSLLMCNLTCEFLLLNCPEQRPRAQGQLEVESNFEVLEIPTDFCQDTTVSEGSSEGQSDSPVVLSLAFQDVLSHCYGLKELMNLLAALKEEEFATPSLLSRIEEYSSNNCTTILSLLDCLLNHDIALYNCCIEILHLSFKCLLNTTKPDMDAWSPDIFSAIRRALLQFSDKICEDVLRSLFVLAVRVDSQQQKKCSDDEDRGDGYEGDVSDFSEGQSNVSVIPSALWFFLRCLSCLKRNALCQMFSQKLCSLLRANIHQLQRMREYVSLNGNFLSVNQSILQSEQFLPSLPAIIDLFQLLTSSSLRCDDLFQFLRLFCTPHIKSSILLEALENICSFDLRCPHSSMTFQCDDPGIRIPLTTPPMLSATDRPYSQGLSISFWISVSDKSTTDDGKPEFHILTLAAASMHFSISYFGGHVVADFERTTGETCERDLERSPLTSCRYKCGSWMHVCLVVKPTGQMRLIFDGIFSAELNLGQKVGRRPLNETYINLHLGPSSNVSHRRKNKMLHETRIGPVFIMRRCLRSSEALMLHCCGPDLSNLTLTSAADVFRPNLYLAPAMLSAYGGLVQSFLTGKDVDFSVIIESHVLTVDPARRCILDYSQLSSRNLEGSSSEEKMSLSRSKSVFSLADQQPPNATRQLSVDPQASKKRSNAASEITGTSRSKKTSAVSELVGTSAVSRKKSEFGAPQRKLSPANVVIPEVGSPDLKRSSVGLNSSGRYEGLSISTLSLAQKSGKGGGVSEEIPVSTPLPGNPDVVKCAHFGTASGSLGGLNAVIYLFAKMVESSDKESVQVKALEILLRVSNQSFRLHDDLCSEKPGLQALVPILQNERCKLGPRLVDCLLEQGCSGFTSQHQFIRNPTVVLFLFSYHTLWNTSRIEPLKRYISQVRQLVAESNPCAWFNRKLCINASLIKSILALITDILEEGHEQPVKCLYMDIFDSLISLLADILPVPPDIVNVSEIEEFLYNQLPLERVPVSSHAECFYFADRSESLMHSICTPPSDAAEHVELSAAEIDNPEPSIGGVAESSRVESDVVFLMITRVLIPQCSLLSPVQLEAFFNRTLAPNFLIVLLNNDDARISNAVVRLVSQLYLDADERTQTAFLDSKCFLLMANQLHQTGHASRELVESVFSMFFGCEFALSSQVAPRVGSKSLGEFQRQSIPLLLSVFLNVSEDVSLARHVLGILCGIFDSYEDVRPIFISSGSIPAMINLMLQLLAKRPITDEIESLFSSIQIFFSTVITRCLSAPNTERILRHVLSHLGLATLRVAAASNIFAKETNMIFNFFSHVLKMSLEVISQLKFAVTPSFERSASIIERRFNLSLRDFRGSSVLSSPTDDSYSPGGSDDGNISSVTHFLTKAGDTLSVNDVSKRLCLVLRFTHQFVLSVNPPLSDQFRDEPIFTSYFGLVKYLLFKLDDFISDLLSSQNTTKWKKILVSSKADIITLSKDLLYHLVLPSNCVLVKTLSLSFVSHPRFDQLFKLVYSKSDSMTHLMKLRLARLMNDEEVTESDRQLAYKFHAALSTLSSQAFANINPEMANDSESLVLVRRDQWQQELVTPDTFDAHYKKLQSEVSEKALAVTKAVHMNWHESHKRRFVRLSAQQKEEFNRLKMLACMVNEVTHSRGVWYEPEKSPNFWQLDQTEGPLRMKRRLRSCYLNANKKHVKNNRNMNEDSYLKFIFKDMSANCFSNSTISAQCENTESEAFGIQDFPCDRILPYVEINGNVRLTDLHLFFKSSKLDGDNNENKKNLALVGSSGTEDFQWSYSSIREIHPRLYSLEDRAVEIFFTSGLSVMLSFATNATREEFSLQLHSQQLPNLVRGELVEQMKKAWVGGYLPNFTYLTVLNKLAGRTTNDLMQYPVFPFVFSDYVSSVINLQSSAIYRDLSKPISIQNPDKEKIYARKYKEMQSSDFNGPTDFGPYHYSSLYSNSGIVLHFMVRVLPFSRMFLDYQGDSFDIPDRTFSDVATTWRLATVASMTDVKELIPEFFYLPEFLTNREKFEFGTRQDGENVGDVHLPPWANNNPRIFVLVHRQALESSNVSKNLSKWIDLIFGFKQTGKAAIEAYNVYRPCLYYGFDLKAITDEHTQLAVERMIRTYGQTPKQVFKVPHQAKGTTNLMEFNLSDVTAVAGGVLGFGPSDDKIISKCPASPIPSVLGIKWGNYVGSPELPNPVVCWKALYRPAIVDLIALPNGKTLGVPQDCVVLYKLTKDLGIHSSTDETMNIYWWGVVKYGFVDGVIRFSENGKGPWTSVMSEPAFDSITCSTVSTDSRHMYLGSQSGLIYAASVKTYNAADKVNVRIELVARLSCHLEKINVLEMSRAFSIFVSGSDDGSVVIWDINSNCFVRSIDVESERRVSVKLLAISETLGDIAAVHDTQDEAPSSVLTVFTVNGDLVGRHHSTKVITAVTYSNAPEGISVNCIVLGLQDGSLQFVDSWVVNACKEVAFGVTGSPVSSLVYRNDCQTLYVSHRDGTVMSVSSRELHGDQRRFIPLQVSSAGGSSSHKQQHKEKEPREQKQTVAGVAARL